MNGKNVLNAIGNIGYDLVLDAEPHSGAATAAGKANKKSKWIRSTSNELRCAYIVPNERIKPMQNVVAL